MNTVGVATARSTEQGSTIVTDQHQYIDCVAKLMDAIVHRPQVIVDTLATMRRFRSQHPTSSVLRHSVEVYELTDGEPGSDRKTWALLHDLHEVITTDIPFEDKTDQHRMREYTIDHSLRRDFGLNVSSADLAHIDRIDRAVGKLELENWGNYWYQSTAEAARLIYLDTLIRLGERIR